jgi:sulfur-oxidizing protein SoxY
MTGEQLKKDAASRADYASGGRSNSARRGFLNTLVVGAVLLATRPAHSTPEELASALRDTFGDRAINPGRVSLELPRLAENSSVVPVIISVDSPMTEENYVRSIYLFAEMNPLPRIFEVHLGPHNGRATISTRIRLATTQRVVAVAILNDDSAWSASYEVEVTISGCG